MLKIKKEGTKCEVEVSISNEEWEKGVQEIYERTKGKYNIGGFRKGHAPRKFIEQTYGDDVFYDDTLNYFVDKSVREVYQQDPELDALTEPEVHMESFSVKDGLKFKLSYIIMPDFKVGKYKGLKIKIENPDVGTVEQCKNELLAENTSYTTVNRPAKMTDKVIIDFVGSIDGVQFEGGSAKDASLVLGDKMYIDTFEEQIAGHNVGDKFDVNVKFPEDYDEESLKGKPATFEVVLKEVQEASVPEFNDKFVSNATEYENVEQYIKATSEHIEDMRQKAIQNTFDNEIIKTIIDNTDVPMPEEFLEMRRKLLINNVEAMAQKSKIDKQLIFKLNGCKDEKDFLDKKMKGFTLYFKSHYILEKIRKLEGLEIDKEEYARRTKGVKDQEALEDIFNELSMNMMHKFFRENNSFEVVEKEA